MRQAATWCAVPHAGSWRTDETVGLPQERPSPAEDELVRPILLPGDPSRATARNHDGWTGLAWASIVASALMAGGYGTSLIAAASPLLMTAMLVATPPAAFVLGVCLSRKGVANPWIRKYERWRKVSLDWKDRALQAEAKLDQLAQDFTGEADPAAARRIMDERIETLKRGRGRGRPKGSHSGMDDETWLRKAREIQKLRRQEMTWDNISKRVGVGVDTARRWKREIDAMDQETA